jgi:benzylsuccinate CoA-transferase BbsF subunit
MENTLPLADVKVVDLMWALAGPTATRVMADYGATVVRVESTRHFDGARTVGPFVKGQAGGENSGLFHNMNAGKLMLTLDLATKTGKEVFLDLVRWTDVVTEAFSPKVMHALGLDYESLCKVKPDLIMLSTCLMGQSGPMSKFAGFGNMAAALSGFYRLTGWPDRPPAGPFSAYTDYVAPRFNAVAVLAALEYRRRTGQGQYIDVSQAEAALHFLGPALLDYTTNGVVQERVGNRDLNFAPHGIYPTQGTDRWIALAVETEAQWEALCLVMERPDLQQDARFAAVAERLAHQDELDAIVGAWTTQHDASRLERVLQARGVPTHVVASMSEMAADAQLLHRHHFVELEHPTLGKTVVEGPRSHLSQTPARVQYSTPTLGRDNQHVLSTILGYSEEKISEVTAGGALG